MFGGRGAEHSGGLQERARRTARVALEADDHDFGGFYKGGDGLAFFQAHFANGIGGDDGGDALAADGEGDLRDQAADFYVSDAADELVAPADAAKIGAAFGNFAVLVRAIEEAVDFFFGDAVVAAGGFYRANFLLVDPLFQRGIADAEDLGGVAWREEFGSRHMDSLEGTPKA